MSEIILTGRKTQIKEKKKTQIFIYSKLFLNVFTSVSKSDYMYM